MEVIGNDSDIGTSIDTILYFTCVVSLNLKYTCIYINGSKLAKNINSAVADWSSAKDEEAYKIMKKHAYKSRMCTLLMLYLCIICGFLYILAVVLINLKDFFLQDQMVDVSNGNVIFL